MEVRGVLLGVNGTMSVGFPCPTCRERCDVSLELIDRDRGIDILCTCCDGVSRIPPSVWCATCGKSLSSGWRDKVMKVREGADRLPKIKGAESNEGLRRVQEVVRSVSRGFGLQFEYSSLEDFVKKGGSTVVVEYLIPFLKNPDKYVRNSAASALNLLGDTRAVGPLIEALSDDYYEVRGTSATALGKIGDKRAIEPLITLLSKDLSARFKTPWGDDAFPADLRTVVEALGEIGDSRAVDVLCEAMKTLMAGKVAAEALGKIGDRKAVEPLIAAVTAKESGSGDWHAIAKALGKIGDAKAIPVLTAMSKEDPFWRSNYEEALTAIANRAT